MSDEPRRRLFLVRVEVELVCWADDEQDAIAGAHEYARDELTNTLVDGLAPDISEITSVKDVPHGRHDAVPHGDPLRDDSNPWEETCDDAARRIEEELRVEKLAAEHEAAQVALPLGDGA